MCTKLLQSCPTLCDPMDSSLPGSYVHGILQARIQEWVAVSLSRGSSQTRYQTPISYVSCTGRQFLYHQHHLQSPLNFFCGAQSLQSCPTLCDPMECSLPGSSVHGIFLARILEQVAMSSSRGSSQPKDQTYISLSLLHCQADSLQLAPPGKPCIFTTMYKINN